MTPTHNSAETVARDDVYYLVNRIMYHPCEHRASDHCDPCARAEIATLIERERVMAKIEECEDISNGMGLVLNERITTRISVDARKIAWKSHLAQLERGGDTREGM